MLEPADDTSDDGEKNSLRSNNITQTHNQDFGTSRSDKVHYKYLSEKDQDEIQRKKASSINYQRKEVLKPGSEINKNQDAGYIERPPTDRRKSIQSVAHVSDREILMDQKDRKESHKIFSTEMKT